MTKETANGAGNMAKAAGDKPLIAGVWRLLALVAVVCIVGQNALFFAMASGSPSRFYGTTGLNYMDRCAADHFCPVDTVKPDSPAAAAGILAGDQVRWDVPMNGLRNKQVGEADGLTVRHAGAERHLVLVSVTKGGLYAPTYMLTAVIDIFVCLTAAFLILRSRGQWPIVLLGLGLACGAMPGGYPRFWQNIPALYVPFLIVLNVTSNVMPVLMLEAMRLFRRDITGRDPAWLRVLVWGLLAFETVSVVVGLWMWLDATSLGLPSTPQTLLSFAEAIGMAVVPLSLLIGWRHVPAGARTRYGFMTAAIVVVSGVSLVDPVITATTNNFVQASVPVVLQLAFGLIGALLFAYAVLRHRVVDIGFAVNQTLVYGVVSFVVLLLFGLAEWGIEKVLPHEWAEANALVSAMIALAIFLVFHRIRDLVEHVIEGLFFHKWRANEARLQRFVSQAAHIVKPDALKAAVVAEFTRFSGGAEVALYTVEGDGFVRDAGRIDGLDTPLDIDLAPLVELRAEGKALYDTDAAELHAALVLPMVQRNDLTGFLALGPKPSREAYRPDERAILAAAAQTIGQDLHALKIEELRRAHDEAVQREALLAARLDIALKAAGLAG